MIGQHKLQFNSKRFLVNNQSRKNLSQFSKSTYKKKSLERIVSKRTVDALQNDIDTSRRYPRDEIALYSQKQYFNDAKLLINNIDYNKISSGNSLNSLASHDNCQQVKPSAVKKRSSESYHGWGSNN